MTNYDMTIADWYFAALMVIVFWGIILIIRGVMGG